MVRGKDALNALTAALGHRIFTQRRAAFPGTSDRSEWRGLDMTKVLAMVALVFTLGACNTVDGVGQDISGAASRIGSWL